MTMQKRERRRAEREAQEKPAPLCPHCGGKCTHEVFAVGFSSEWQPICADYAQECEDNQREVYEHEMSNFGGAYGLPDVRVRLLGAVS